MVIETNVTYDYSFYYKQNTNVNPSPKTHNDVYYHRMQDTTPHIPIPPHSMNMGNMNMSNMNMGNMNMGNMNMGNMNMSNMNMGNINRDKSGEAYYEFVYSPILPKKSIETSMYHVKEISEKNMSYYLKRLFCCG